MMPHGLDAIAEVGRFLEQDLLPSLPAALRGELRAAIKLLHSAAAELNVMTPLLRRECSELLALNDESAPILATHAPAPPDTTLRARLADTELNLRGLFTLHDEVQLAVTLRMTALLSMVATAGTVGERSRALLLRFYQTLEHHAAQRLPWQSVFAGSLSDEVT